MKILVDDTVMIEDECLFLTVVEVPDSIKIEEGCIIGPVEYVFIDDVAGRVQSGEFKELCKCTVDLSGIQQADLFKRALSSGVADTYRTIQDNIHKEDIDLVVINQFLSEFMAVTGCKYLHYAYM